MTKTHLVHTSSASAEEQMLSPRREEQTAALTHHFLVNPTEHTQNCVLVSRRRLEGGRKKLTRGSLLKHQGKTSLRRPASVCDLRPLISSAPRYRT